jgi:superoxide dismutase, Cu-Zn family
MMNYSKIETFYSLAVSLIVGIMGLTQVSADQTKAEQRAEAAHLKDEVQLPTHGVVRLLPTKNSKVHGMLWLTETKEGLQIKGEVLGLTPGMHGFHIHEFGDLSDPQGKSAGGHFNPGHEEHGGPEGEHHHAGDLGNIKAGEDGKAEVQMDAPWLKLHFVIGRSFVVHAGADDLKTQPAGDSGDRVAVGVIGIAQSKEKEAVK